MDPHFPISSVVSSSSSTWGTGTVPVLSTAVSSNSISSNLVGSVPVVSNLATKLQAIRIPMDKLPIEIIDNILLFLNLEDLSGLIDDDLHLIANQHIYHSIIRKISGGKFSFNNRLGYLSFQHMYKLTPTYENKSTYHYLARSPQRAITVMHQFKHCIPVENSITISYYIWSLSELVEVLDLLHNLPSIYKYNLELEFDADIDYIFDGTNIFKQIQYFHDKTPHNLISLLIYNFKQVYTIDISKFRYLQRLWLINCQLSVINSNSNFLPSQGFDLKIDINSRERFKDVKLDVNSIDFIDHLTLAGEGINTESFCKSSLSQNLKKLQVANLQNIVHFTFNQNLEHLSIEDLNQSFQVNQNLLEKLPNLNTLELTGIHYDELNPPNFQNTKLTTLKLCKFEPQIISHLVFPTSLIDLNISNNKLEDITFIDSLTQIPESLLKLNLADNPIKWDVCIPNFKRFKQLSYLKLSNTNIRYNLVNIKFPDTIETLSLEVNNIPSIENVEFPKKLKDLGLGCNSIRKIEDKKHFLPSSLKTLHLTENRLSRDIVLDVNGKNQHVNIEVLYLDRNHIHDIKDIFLPRRTKILNLDQNYIKLIDKFTIPASIEELSLVGNGFRDFNGVFFAKGSKLRVIDISLNSVSLFSVTNFPTGLEILKAKTNRIKKIGNKKSFSKFHKLKCLDVSQNILIDFEFEFGENFEKLIINSNRIKSLKLSFPQGSSVPKLKSVCLYNNKVKALTALNLGLGGQRSIGSQLHELDVFGNPISKDHVSINKLITSLKSSLSSVFIKAGSRDQYNSRYSLNYMPNPLGIEKILDESWNWGDDGEYSDMDSDDYARY